MNDPLRHDRRCRSASGAVSEGGLLQAAQTWLVIVVGIAFTATVAAQMPRLRPRDVDALPSRPADFRVTYGDDPLQFGELRLPSGSGPFPVAIVIHGGCWVSRFATLQNTAALSDALRNAGVATWNIEYRRLDNPGGGWPGTFVDVGGAADHVRVLAKSHPLDLSRVVSLGHSAGAHLALWLAARAKLPASSVLYSPSPLPLAGVVALGGPGDLRDFTTYARGICGGPVIEQLLGGSPEQMGERYDQASPLSLLPLETPQVLVVGVDDGVMPKQSRDAYIAAARAAGDAAEVIVVPDAGHFEVIAPTTAAWPTVRDQVLKLAGAAAGRLD